MWKNLYWKNTHCTCCWRFLRQHSVCLLTFCIVTSQFVASVSVGGFFKCGNHPLGNLHHTAAFLWSANFLFLSDKLMPTFPLTVKLPLSDNSNRYESWQVPKWGTCFISFVSLCHSLRLRKLLLRPIRKTLTLLINAGSGKEIPSHCGVQFNPHCTAENCCCSGFPQSKWLLSGWLDSCFYGHKCCYGLCGF